MRVPRLHRGALVGAREVREHRVARLDLRDVSLDDLRFVPLGAAAEVAAHRVDGLVPRGAEQRVRAAAVLLGERRTGEIDAHRRHTIRSMSNEFVALGHAGSDHYAGLETFPNPGVTHVDMTSDELSAMCPITSQPDFYTAQIEYRPGRLCLESKSLKLYLATFRNEGAFCEALAVKIRDDVAEALELAPDEVTVTLVQKARGGITITAVA